VAYTVRQLARMAGVSVRTLHHYDSIALLEAGSRTAAGYRLYGEPELLRLQQILFYRELDMPLEKIGSALDRPGFDPVAALEGHRRLLAEKAERIARLIQTVDRTIGRLKGENMLSDQELYEGFSQEEIDAIKKESLERWGETEAFKQSQGRVARMTKEQWKEVRAEGEAVDGDAAEALARGSAPDSPQVESIMERKFRHLCHFYEPSLEMFEGLGRMYVEDPRFRAHYEERRPGLAEFMRAAMAAYAARRVRGAMSAT
jgi:DNA-binding transcriptional MerR regulator